MFLCEPMQIKHDTSLTGLIFDRVETTLHFVYSQNIVRSTKHVLEMFLYFSARPPISDNVRRATESVESSRNTSQSKLDS